MITRRQLRIKALQAFYAHHTTGRSLQNTLKVLEDSIESVYELFLLEVKALSEFHRFEEERLERGRNKKMPSAEDLQPNTALLDNPILKHIRFSDSLTPLYDDYAIRWGDDRDLLYTVYQRMIQNEAYDDYKAIESPTIEDHRAFLLEVYTQFFAYNDTLQELYESRSIHWSDDLEAVQMLMVALIKHSTETEFNIPPLFKSEEDHEYVVQLLRKAVQNSDYFGELIAAQTKNWEADRIALIDMMLMKLALAELVYFPQIPIKVSFNEYLELSKQFSTSRSAVFINGVLDKLTGQLKDDEQIRKIGKGLL